MFFENLKESLACIMSNKLRSALTMLGIIIGISAVITITTIGSSIKGTISSTMNSLGGTDLYVMLEAVYPEDQESWADWQYPEMTDEDLITDEMIEALKEAYPDVVQGASVTEIDASGKIARSEEDYAKVITIGVSDGWLISNKVKVTYGRSITEQDFKEKKNVVVIPNTLADYYFKDEEPIGQQITFDSTSQEGDSFERSYVIVGVYQLETKLFGKVDTTVPPKDRPYYCLVPYTAVNRSEGYNYIGVSVNPKADQKAALATIQEYFQDCYADNPNWTVEVSSLASELGIINTVINVITVAIALIAAISLIVGGVGVMNIMLVSITERTREIGVRMALGAKKRTIRAQFVLEAIVLCLIGGAIGILLGVVNGAILGVIAQFFIKTMYSDYADLLIISVRPSILAILLSLFFSMLTGVFFGFYPANKAANMEVIDALRYE